MEWIERIENEEWFGKTDKYSFVRVWKIGLSSAERKKRGIGLYGFHSRIGLKGEEVRKYFSKKSQALQYAKEWMEKK
jgi:hypothetical protein